MRKDFSFRFCFLTVLAVFVCVSVSDAAIINSSIANKGSKKYSLKSYVNGWSNVVLTNTAAIADLDLGFTVVSNSQEVTLGNSASAVKQLEKLTVGVDSTSQFYIYVISYSGSSAFRMAVSLEGDVSNTAMPQQMMPQQMILEEVPMDSNSEKIVNEMKRTQKALHK